MTEFSYQLYSSRNFGPWAATYAMLAKAGYTMVEGFGGVYEDAGATKAALDAAGLTMPSGHFFPAGAFEDGLEDSLATAKALGMKRVFCPAPEDDLRDNGTSEDWKALAHRLEAAAPKLRDAGLDFGWHNHHWEFMPLPDGSIAMEILLQEAPSIDWEMDVAWVVKGGGDPLAWMERYADRITTAHIKDIAADGECEDEDGWADVGHGTMDWAGLTTALRKTRCDLFIMEHDNPSDHARFAERSIASTNTY
ncbi:Sugar phosphate isomerase [Candidatus Rhodobacter oscarellae]|uniref:Sugar phosphate isomerase n=1 Tax=Candidatus Rhodobacter oscarellae TaxID=1675527 RepID=A0A0J9EF37_9RHOB|nr:sugar phosphate isomerase/epimerase [Candidatus Rhodobacter lobularis]KMW60294.1 Sugar phosphate isomerase [Candidatus Rhodobacter lobularis]